MAAQGDKESFDLLYSLFKKQADVIINLTMSKIANLSKNPVDFTDFIDYLFFRSIKEYDPDRGSFSNYVDYVFKIRLCTKVQEEAIDYANMYAEIQSEDVEELSVETMIDPQQKTIQHEVAIKRFKSSISSPNRYLNKNERVRNKILMMQYVGYSNTEICKELNITPGILRGHLEKLKKDNRVVNLKLEIK